MSLDVPRLRAASVMNSFSEKQFENEEEDLDDDDNNNNEMQVS